MYASDGPASATWNSLEPAFQAALGEAGRQIVDEVEAETRSIYEHAREFWPVAHRSSRDSRGKLGWQMSVSQDEIKGTVRNASEYARFIQSDQASPDIPTNLITNKEMWYEFRRSTTKADFRAMRALVKRLPAENQERVQAAIKIRAYMRGKGGGKLGGKAARSGSAMWILLRWPEAAAGRRLTEALGPLLEQVISEAVR